MARVANMPINTKGSFSVCLRELKVSFQFYCLTTKQKIRKCSEP